LGFSSTTSSTSTTIGIGSKVFSVSNTGAYVIGTQVRVVNTGSSTNFMEGAITALSTNSSITVNVTNISGSGTFSAWTFTVAGLVGPSGSGGGSSGGLENPIINTTVEFIDSTSEYSTAQQLLATTTGEPTLVISQADPNLWLSTDDGSELSSGMFDYTPGTTLILDFPGPGFPTNWQER
jgi:hypothetical protein